MESEGSFHARVLPALLPGRPQPPKEAQKPFLLPTVLLASDLHWKRSICLGECKREEAGHALKNGKLAMNGPCSQ